MMLAKVFLFFCGALFLSRVCLAQDEEHQETLSDDPALKDGNEVNTEARGGLNSIFNWARRRTGKPLMWRRHYLKYPRTTQQNDQDDIAQIESFKDFIRRLRSLRIRIRRKRPQKGSEANIMEGILPDTDGKKADSKNMAEKEGLWDLYTVGKKLYKAYNAYQDGIATKEDIQDINDDIDRMLQLQNAMAADEDGNEGRLANEEGIFTIPALLYNAYKGYKLYKNYVG